VTRRGRWIRGLTPPVARDALRAVRERLRPTYEYVPQGWARAHEEPPVRGWNSAAVIDGSLKTWPAFVEAVSGTEPLAAFHEVAEAEDVSTEDLGAHNLIMSYGYALALAAGGRERVSVLDWGGGLGHYYLLTRALLPDTVLDYHCRDVPAMVAEGSRILPQAVFHSDDQCLERGYDLVFVSGSLQYSEDWRERLGELARAADPWLFITRLPVVSETDSFVVLQHAFRAGYDTEYLGWVLDQRALKLEAEELRLQLIREFLTGEVLEARGAPERAKLRGFLFRGTPALTRDP
jgi:putative methyltransferase (TIGR04325 family)